MRAREWKCEWCAEREQRAEAEAEAEAESKCILCPFSAGALKRTAGRPSSWVHLCCALWLPGCAVSRGRPVVNFPKIPSEVWNARCYLCRGTAGACLRCTHPACTRTFHVLCGAATGLPVELTEAQSHATLQQKQSQGQGQGHSQGQGQGQGRLPVTVACHEHCPAASAACDWGDWGAAPLQCDSVAFAFVARPPSASDSPSPPPALPAGARARALGLGTLRRRDSDRACVGR